jgi:hypothetical protein
MIEPSEGMSPVESDRDLDGLRVDAVDVEHRPPRERRHADYVARSASWTTDLAGGHALVVGRTMTPRAVCARVCRRWTHRITRGSSAD